MLILQVYHRPSVGQLVIFTDVLMLKVGLFLSLFVFGSCIIFYSFLLLLVLVLVLLSPSFFYLYFILFFRSARTSYRTFDFRPSRPR